MAKDIKKIAGHYYKLVGRLQPHKADLADLARSYRSGKKLYNGKKAKSARIVKHVVGYTFYGYGLYVR